MIRSFCRYLAFRGEQSQRARVEGGQAEAKGTGKDERKGAPCESCQWWW